MFRKCEPQCASKKIAWRINKIRFLFGLTKKTVYLCTTKNGDSVAQQVEHNTFNVGVLGSSPSWITREAGDGGRETGPTKSLL